MLNYRNNMFSRFSVTPAFLCLVFLYAFAGNLSLLPAILSAALLHECGHLIMIRLLGLKVDKIEATLLGFLIRTNAGLSSYLSEILISLSGPALSIIVAVCSSVAASRGFYSESLYIFSGMNIIFGIFNLLPASKLDGGRAVHSLLCLFFSPDDTYRISSIISVVTAVFVILAGAYILYTTKYNLSLLLIGLWLLVRSNPDNS
ncbi:MAG: site-2 protease family protein [Clostridiales bacterium]|nr:site-2 protease family protein [Clostridiales bacterium]